MKESKQHPPAGAAGHPSEQDDQRKAEETEEESCRCKEVSKKTPFEMLKLMLSDLAFWKKDKKEK